MKYYLAPMEGTTGYIYRNAVHRWFGTGIDKYFTPFIVPHPKKALTSREIADILPENNSGITLIPQVLTNSARDLLRFEDIVRSYGYEEININIGCPSGTVTAKGRGAGFLETPDSLDAFLQEVYAHTKCRISVKTRIGMYETDEWPALLDIYNKYPISELIVHPRTGKEMYSGTVHMDAWRYTVEHTHLPLCYNGDILRPDLKPLTDEIQAVMIGRGMIADPSLIRQINGGEPASYEELKGFLTQLRQDYTSLYGDTRNVLHRLKEIWAFMGGRFPQYARELKSVMKSESMDSYKVAENILLRRIAETPHV